MTSARRTQPPGFTRRRGSRAAIAAERARRTAPNMSDQGAERIPLASDTSLSSESTGRSSRGGCDLRAGSEAGTRWTTGTGVNAGARGSRTRFTSCGTTARTGAVFGATRGVLAETRATLRTQRLGQPESGRMVRAEIANRGLADTLRIRRASLASCRSSGSARPRSSFASPRWLRRADRCQFRAAERPR